MNAFQKFLANLPLPISGVMLAAASLGVLFPQFFTAVPIPAAGFVLHVLFGAAAAVILVLLLLKAVLFPQQIKAALKDPILASVAGTFPMALMALAVFLFETAAVAGTVLWYAGVILHAALIVYFSIRFLRRPNLAQLFPSWLVVYVGIVLAAITAPYFNQIFLGQICFLFGAVLVVPLTAVLLFRCRKLPLAEPAKPLICIFAAPVSIILAGYIQSFPADPELVRQLLIAETLILLLVLMKLPSLLRLPFYPSYAAFTFPFVVTATAYFFGVQTLVEAGLISFEWYAVPAAVILLAAGLVVYVLVQYAFAMKKAVQG